jgi:L-threonylcarbamoyladenylate synthase
MKASDLRLDLWFELTRCVIHVLRGNGVAVLPSETSYMLAGNACNKSVVERIQKLKNRPAGMDISVAVASPEAARKWVEWPGEAQKFADAFLPGPLTLILPKRISVNCNFASSGDSLGIRIPGHRGLLNIISRLDFPVTATSANVHGRPEPFSVEDCVSGADFVWDAGNLPQNPPSTIVSLVAGNFHIIREGAITRDDLLNILKHSNDEITRI